MFDAVAETGIPDEILARFPALRRHDPQVGRREGSHCYRGVVGPEVAARWPSAAVARSGSWTTA